MARPSSVYISAARMKFGRWKYQWVKIEEEMLTASRARVDYRNRSGLLRARHVEEERHEVGDAQGQRTEEPQRLAWPHRPKQCSQPNPYDRHQSHQHMHAAQSRDAAACLATEHGSLAGRCVAAARCRKRSGVPKDPARIISQDAIRSLLREPSCRVACGSRR